MKRTKAPLGAAKLAARSNRCCCKVVLLSALPFLCMAAARGGESVGCGTVWPYNDTTNDMVSVGSIGPIINHIIVKCKGTPEDSLNEEFFGSSVQTKLDSLKADEQQGKVWWSVKWKCFDPIEGTWGASMERTFDELYKRIEERLKDQARWDKEREIAIAKGFKRSAPKPGTIGYWSHTPPMATVDCGSDGGSIPPDEEGGSEGAFVFQRPPGFPGDLRADGGQLDNRQSFRDQLPRQFGGQGRRVVDLMDRYEESRVNAPSSPDNDTNNETDEDYWGDALKFYWERLARGTIRFFRTPAASLRGFWRKIKDLRSDAERFRQKLNKPLEEPFRDIETAVEAAEFSMNATETIESLMLPSSKSFLGSYQRVEIASIGDYFGGDLAIKFVEMAGDSSPQVPGVASISSLPDGRIRVSSSLGNYDLPDPTSVVDARKFLRASAPGTDVDQGGVFGKTVTIGGAPPGDNFKTVSFFIPTWRATLANSTIGGVGAYRDIPEENWLWYSYQSERTEGTLGESALYMVNLVYRADGRHFLHIFDVGKLSYGLYALDPETSQDVRTPPVLEIAGSGVVTKAGYKVLEVPAGGSVTLSGTWSEGTQDIRWRQDLFTVQQGGNELALRNVTEEDEGLYRISGSNADGVGVSEAVAVMVNGTDPTPPPIAKEQKVTFKLPPKMVYGGEYILKAKFSAKGAVIYAVDPASAAEISGNRLRVLKAGTAFQVTARQAGDAIWKAAERGVVGIAAKRPQKIAFTVISAVAPEQSFNLLTTCGSQLPVTITSSDPTIVRVNGDGTATALRAGKVVLVATQGGDENYWAAKPVSKKVTVK